VPVAYIYVYHCQLPPACFLSRVYIYYIIHIAYYLLPLPSSCFLLLIYIYNTTSFFLYIVCCLLPVACFLLLIYNNIHNIHTVNGKDYIILLLPLPFLLPSSCCYIVIIDMYLEMCHLKYIIVKRGECIYNINE